MSINWGSIYNNPVGSILNDISLQQMESLMTGPYQQQVTSLQAASTMYTNQQKAWTTLQSDASATASSLSTLSQASTFQQLAATSSNTNVATASDNSAQAGSYNLTVTQLAQAEIDQGSSANMQVSSPSSALGLSGSFTVAVGSGSAKTINVSSTDTLNTIAQNINNSGAGVKATVEQQSSGNWILAIQGNTTGSGQGITFTDTAGSGSTYGPLYSLGLYNDPSNAKFRGSGAKGPRCIAVLWQQLVESHYIQHQYL